LIHFYKRIFYHNFVEWQDRNSQEKVKRSEGE